MDVTYDPSLSAQQKGWAEDAIRLATFKWEQHDVNVNFVVVAEPPCPGHSDYMCTQTGDFINFTVNIRQGADDPNQSFNKGLPNPAADIKGFYMESIIHELGHVIVKNRIDRTSAQGLAAALFRYHKEGEGERAGTEADWEGAPDTAWADRIQEAAAEVFKDTVLNDAYRIFDNRTNWTITETDHHSFIQMLTFVEDATFNDAEWGVDLGDWAYPYIDTGFFFTDDVIFVPENPDPDDQHLSVRYHNTFDDLGTTSPITSGYPGPRKFVDGVWVAIDPADYDEIKCEIWARAFDPWVREYHPPEAGGNQTRPLSEAQGPMFTLEFGGNFWEAQPTDYHRISDTEAEWRVEVPNALDLAQQAFASGHGWEFHLTVWGYAEPAPASDWPELEPWPRGIVTTSVTKSPGYAGIFDNFFPFAAINIDWTGKKFAATDAPPYPYDDPVLDMEQGAHQVQRMGPTHVK